MKFQRSWLVAASILAFSIPVRAQEDLSDFSWMDTSRKGVYAVRNQQGIPYFLDCVYSVFIELDDEAPWFGGEAPQWFQSDLTPGSDLAKICEVNGYL